MRAPLRRARTRHPFSINMENFPSSYPLATEKYINITRESITSNFLNNYVRVAFPTIGFLPCGTREMPPVGGIPDDLSSLPGWRELCFRCGNVNSPFECEVINRVFTCYTHSNVMDLNSFLHNHVTNVCTNSAANLSSLIYRGKKLMRVHHQGRIAKIWTNSANKYYGGCIIRFVSPFVSTSKTLCAKVYHDSPTMQLNGAITSEDALYAFKTLRSILQKLDKTTMFTNYMASTEITADHVAPILENSRVNTHRPINNCKELVELLEDSRVKFADHVSSSFTCIKRVALGNNRVRVRYEINDAHATLTVCSSGRGFLSATHPNARLIAILSWMNFIEMFPGCFQDFRRREPIMSAVKGQSAQPEPSHPSSCRKSPTASLRPPLSASAPELTSREPHTPSATPPATLAEVSACKSS